SAAGSALSLVLLSTVLLPMDLGWRLAFGFGAVLGIAVFVVRRHVPERPRWLFIHGREEEAERIVRGLEESIEQEKGQELPPAVGSLPDRQATAIPFRLIAAVAFRKYPKRSLLCLALFVGQAFLYHGISFILGVLLSCFYDVGAALAPLFSICWALSNLAGPVLLGHFFDSVGRKP